MKVENGKWKTESGKRKVESGKWKDEKRENRISLLTFQLSITSLTWQRGIRCSRGVSQGH